jgi:hypothetical protein
MENAIVLWLDQIIFKIINTKDMKKSIESIKSKKFTQILEMKDILGGREACSWNSSGTVIDDANVTNTVKTDWGYQMWQWDEREWYRGTISDQFKFAENVKEFNPSENFDFSVLKFQESNEF